MNNRHSVPLDMSGDPHWRTGVAMLGVSKRAPIVWIVYADDDDARRMATPPTIGYVCGLWREDAERTARMQFAGREIWIMPTDVIAREGLSPDAIMAAALIEQEERDERKREYSRLQKQRARDKAKARRAE